MKSLLKRLISAIDLSAFYLREIITSNLKVALDIITPQHMMNPSFLRVYAGDLTPRQLMVANNLICMTPGTLCADYDNTTDELVVHTMYSSDPAKDTDLIRKTYFTKIKNVF